MYRSTFFSLFLLSSLGAQMPSPEMFDSKKIAIQNTILAKVNETTISVIDVKKKLDVMFYQSYPHLTHSSAAQLQFYESGWRSALLQMIDHELILADAAAKEIKLSDGEVREEMESRFGPNVFATLDKLNITYEEAWKMVKNDLIVQRMTWWFIQSKAIQSVTPHSIKQAYRDYLQEHPSYQQLKYQVIVIRGDESKTIGEKVHHLVNTLKQPPDLIADEIKAIDPTIQISTEYVVKDHELSKTHFTALSGLEPGSYGVPMDAGDKQKTVRMFYLKERLNFEAPAFADLSQKLRNALLQESMAKASADYIEKLRKQYGFAHEQIKEQFPEGMHPFSLQ